MKRDEFISKLVKLGALGATNVLAQQVLGDVSNSAIDKENDQILILIQLIGGNDGLNTVIPIKYWDQLQHHRGNILPKQKSLIHSNSNIAFHPAAAAFQNLVQQQKMCVVHGVGYEQPNRSHFRSMDIWNTGSPSNQFWTSGWLGRYLDICHPNYPSNYPNVKHPHPMVVTVGNDVAETCQGAVHQFSYALSDFNQLVQKVQETSSSAANISGNYLQLVDYLNKSAKLTNAYSASINQVQLQGKNNISYPNSELAWQLSMIAKLVNGGITTKVFTVTVGGFDTHAYQVDKDDVDGGNHATLLATLGNALTAFLEDLKRGGNHQRVLGLIYSEFGRQIKSNESLGTDHGEAAPVFIFGNELKHQFVGKLPHIPDELLDQEAVPMQIDFKAVYSEIIQHWFGLSPLITNNIFPNLAVNKPIGIF